MKEPSNHYKIIIVLSVMLIGLLINFSVRNNDMSYSMEPIDTDIVIEEPEIINNEETEITTIERVDLVEAILLSIVGLFSLSYIIKVAGEF